MLSFFSYGETMTTSEELDNSIDLEEKSPPSSSLFNRLSLLCATVDLLLIVIGIITYQINHKVGLNVISSIYIPAIILWLFAMYLAVTERLRASYLSAKVSIFLCVLIAAMLIAIAVYEAVKFGTFYIAPFNPPPEKL